MTAGLVDGWGGRDVTIDPPPSLRGSQRGVTLRGRQSGDFEKALAGEASRGRITHWS